MFLLISRLSFTLINMKGFCLDTLFPKIISELKCHKILILLKCIMAFYLELSRCRCWFIITSPKVIIRLLFLLRIFQFVKIVVVAWYFFVDWLFEWCVLVILVVAFGGFIFYLGLVYTLLGVCWGLGTSCAALVFLRIILRDIPLTKLSELTHISEHITTNFFLFDSLLIHPLNFT